MKTLMALCSCFDPPPVGLVGLRSNPSTQGLGSNPSTRILGDLDSSFEILINFARHRKNVHVFLGQFIVDFKLVDHVDRGLFDPKHFNPFIFARQPKTSVISLL